MNEATVKALQATYAGYSEDFDWLQKNKENLEKQLAEIKQAIVDTTKARDEIADDLRKAGKIVPTKADIAILSGKMSPPPEDKGQRIS